MRVREGDLGIFLSWGGRGGNGGCSPLAGKGDSISMAVYPHREAVIQDKVNTYVTFRLLGCLTYQAFFTWEIGVVFHFLRISIG